MVFNKVILLAAFSACFVVMTSALPQFQKQDTVVNGLEQEPIAAGPAAPVPVKEHQRDKKFAVFSSYAYTYPSVYSYPYSSYSYSYPKTVYHPYAYGSYYPGYHYIY